MNPLVTIETWGDFALWSRPEGKVERLTYPVPTPSGLRGLLSAIYAKPPEFYWQVRRLEVLRPIAYATFRRNEVKSKMARLTEANPLKSVIHIEEERTQRQSVALKNVRYRVTAEIVPRPDYAKPAETLRNQFERRVRAGQNFMQPCMGTREFPAYYAWGSSGEAPIDLDLDLGYMLYDVFDLNRRQTENKASPYVTLFHARLVRGVMDIPPFDSPLVLRPEGGARHA